MVVSRSVIFSPLILGVLSGVGNVIKTNHKGHARGSAVEPGCRRLLYIIIRRTSLYVLVGSKEVAVYKWTN